MRKKRAILVITLLLCVATIGIGLLTNMQGADQLFQNDNPQLYTETETASFFGAHP